MADIVAHLQSRLDSMRARCKGLDRQIWAKDAENAELLKANATAKADALTEAAEYFDAQGNEHACTGRFAWDWAARVLHGLAKQAQQGEKGGA